MSYHSRRILTPGPTKKREREDHHHHHHKFHNHNHHHHQPFYYSSLKPSSASAPALAPARPGVGSAVFKPGQIPPKPADPVLSNRLLAGYMAHEFLTQGTLFGQKFDPARAEAVPVGGSSAEPKRAVAAQSGKSEHGSYADVANILKSDGAHIPGVVNPTQLARWIQM